MKLSPPAATVAKTIAREAEQLFDKVNEVIREQVGDSYKFLPFHEFTDAITRALSAQSQPAAQWTAGPDGCGRWGIYHGEEKLKGWSGKGKLLVSGLSELQARQIVTHRSLESSLSAQ